MKKAIFLLLFAVILLSGCATMIRGGSQAIRVTSDPSGAIVSSGSKTGRTPTRIAVSRKKASHTFLIQKKGYVPRRVTVRRVNKPISFANIILLPAAPFGIIADTNTGADFVFEPDRVHVKLIPVDSQQAQRMISVQIYDLTVIPSEVLPGSAFGFRLDYMITDGTMLSSKAAFDLIYSIVKDNNILFEDMTHLTAPKNIRHRSQKTDLIAGKKSGVYQLKVQIRYKSKVAEKIEQFRVR